MAESEKAKEMRHARTLTKLAKEERQEAVKMRAGGVTSKEMLRVGRNLARVANQKSTGRKGK